MRVATAPLAFTPMTRGGFDDASEPSPFAALLPEQRRIFLVLLGTGGGASPSRRATAQGDIRVTPGGDTRIVSVSVGQEGGGGRFSFGSAMPSYDGKLWRARMERPPEYEIDLFRGGEVIGGAAGVTFGPLRLLASDGEIDNLRNENLGGIDVDILMGAAHLAFDQFGVIMRGRVEGTTWDRDLFTLAFSDPRARLDVPLQETAYQGTGLTGGIEEGNNDLKGRLKPRLLGVVRQAEPVLVNRVWQIYQINDRGCQRITAAYDRLVPLTFAGDVSDPGAPLSVYSWTPVGGEFFTDRSAGLIRLGAEPTGIVTVDARGDINADGSLITSAVDLVRHIASETPEAPLTTSEVALSSFAGINPAPLGIYLDGSRQASVLEVAQQIMASVGGYLRFTRDGRLSVGIVRFGAPVATLTEGEIMDLRRVEPPRPVWRRKLGYGRSWRVQDQDAINEAAAPEFIKTFAARDLRFAVAEDAQIKNVLLLARDTEAETLMVQQADAQDEADRQLSLLGQRRDEYEVRLQRHQYKLLAGQTVRVEHPDLRLPQGQRLFIRRIAERGNGETVLTLWG